MIKTRKQMITVIGVFALVLMLGTVTYAFFNYTRTGVANNIRTGRIYFNTSQNGTINLTNIFPVASSEVGNNNQIEVRVYGDTTYAGGEEFEISLVSVNNTIVSGSTEKTIPVNYIASYVATPVATGEDPNNIGTNSNSYFNDRGSITAVYKLNTTGVVSEGEQVLIGYIPKDVAIDGTLTIKAYLDASNIAITDTYDETSPETDYNGTPTNWVDGRTVFTTTEWNTLQNTPISFKVRAIANEGTWLEDTRGFKRVLKSIDNYEGERSDIVWVDTLDTESTSDDVIYFSGTSSNVDFNYIWYSGKLWRVISIYPDGSMKLITDDSITAMQWGNTIEYNGSWIYQWLNEDFLDTLFNYNEIIETSTWYYSTDGSNLPVRYDNIYPRKTVNAKVGLLNYYEYYAGCRCIGSATCKGYNYYQGFLYINQGWWLITPHTSSLVHYVGSQGGYPSNSDFPYDRYEGVRPSIVIKSELEFTGDGTKTNPYKIVGDKSDPQNNVTLISSRTSGEYVLFDNDLYRIVESNETLGTTKIVRLDYLRDSGSVITKRFASSLYFGESTNTQSNTYWDYYLNNTWYDSISESYKRMLVDDTYYLGIYEIESNTNYKSIVCKDDNIDSVQIKNCTKYTANDEHKTFTGKVGLLRLSEMFVDQLVLNGITKEYMWSITPTTNSKISVISVIGGSFGAPYNNYNDTYSVRPSITLKSGIKIVSGTGMANDPFEISE